MHINNATIYTHVDTQMPSLLLFLFLFPLLLVSSLLLVLLMVMLLFLVLYHLILFVNTYESNHVG